MKEEELSKLIEECRAKEGETSIILCPLVPPNGGANIFSTSPILATLPMKEKD